jgi:outer membrane protein
MRVRIGEELRRRRRESARLLLALTCAVGLVAGGCATAPSTQPVVRVGVVDPQRVLNETEAGKKARESLNAFMKNRQALIELEEKELRRMEEDLIKQASVLSANAKKEREEQFRRRMAEYQQKANELNREVQEKQKEVLEGFREKVEKVVAKVAQRLGLVVVIEKGRGGTTLYHDPSLDISVMVIEEFNKGTP